VIKESIKLEEEGGNDSFSSIVHGNPLWQAFVTPFTDIIDTGMYAVKRIGNVTAQEAGSIVLQTAAALIPFVGADTMDAIEATAKANIQKQLEGLDEQYANVINRNLDAIFNQSDVWGLAFLFNPAMILGSKLLVTAPQVLAGTVGFMLGGKDVRANDPNAIPQSIGDMLVTLAGDLQRLETDPANFFFSKRKVGGGQQQSNFDMNLVHSQGGSYDMYGDTDALYEQQVQQPQQQAQPQQRASSSVTPQMIKQAKANIIAAIKKIFTNPQLKQQLAASKFSKQLQASGTSAIQQGVKQTFGSIRSYAQLQQKYGSNPQFKKIDDSITAGLKKQNMNDQQIVQEKEKLLPQVKKQFKGMLVKQLQNTKMDPRAMQNIQKVIQTIS